MIDDRIAARRQEVRDGRRRARRRRTIVVAGLLIVVLALVLVERSALVGLEEVRITGVQRLSVAEVEAAADVPLGTSTLRLRLGDVADRVAALPLVRDASARRLDPLTILIEVVERQPVLVAEGADRQVLVDRDGVVIAAGTVESLPVVALTEPPPQPGGAVRELAALANAHAAWRGMSGPLRARIQRYDATADDDLELLLADGVVVRFGRAERVAEKVRALGAVLEDVGATPVTRIDVRAPGAPVIVGES